MAPIKFISLEGNVGSGKTTLLAAVKTTYPSYRIIEEPVDLWMSLKTESGESLLELFYKDKQRWSYTFQYSAFFTRYISSLKAIQAARADPSTTPIILLTERSILTDKHVFASMLKDQGFMNKLEWDLYNIWFDNFAKDIQVDAIVYLETPPTICTDRIKVRARSGEDNIPLDYLTDLQTYHDQWLGSKLSIPVLRMSNKDSVDHLRLFIESIVPA
jgi:deoxyadenosine/deoxycytidine kinase